MFLELSGEVFLQNPFFKNVGISKFLLRKYFLLPPVVSDVNTNRRPFTDGRYLKSPVQLNFIIITSRGSYWKYFINNNNILIVKDLFCTLFNLILNKSIQKQPEAAIKSLKSFLLV